MRLADFDFDLPEELIATRPVKPRSAARMLVYAQGALRDSHVFDLPQFLRPGDRLVFNNTKVIPARLWGQRLREGGAGARIEVVLLSPAPGGLWRALLRPLRKVAPGEVISFAAGLAAKMVAREGTEALLRFNLEGAAFEAALALAGEMPLPPYIASKRAADEADKSDYQTLFARHAGAVAAPTAALHFDPALMAALKARGVEASEVTLHVGAGTFLPVKVEDPRQHKMHAEWGQVSAEAAAAMNATRAGGGRLIAVGTTSLRLLESAFAKGQIQAYQGETDIFLYPGRKIQAADGLMTNFHLPKSTLLMLVAALIGVEAQRAVYAHALAARYRFFSYGDASLLLP